MVRLMTQTYKKGVFLRFLGRKGLPNFPETT